MNLAEPFVRRAVATSLLSLGLLLIGLVSYRALPVASMPSIEFPVIRVNASRPGANPETMAASVAAPLERRLGAISGVTEITSSSSLGSTSIALQFDVSRRIDKAAQDVQSAINAAVADLPSDMPSLPSVRKVNPTATPILVLALTSRTLPTSELYDAADSVIVQRLSQIDGVADVTVSGAEQPAIRVEVDPAQIAASGISLEQVRTAIANGAAYGPVGSFEGERQSEMIVVNSQFRSADEFHQLTLRAKNGTILRMTDIARVTDGVRNIRASGSYDGRPAVLITITKSATANVVATADKVRELLPELRRWLPADIDVSIMTDRTRTIRASIEDMQKTLALSIILVMAVVFLFLGRTVPTLAAAITIPLSFAGTFAGMWLAGFSIDNLSLMALAISVGFVVDDAIVVIETVVRRIEAGEAPLQAAITGAGRIAFTVLTISLSLVAAFLPLMFASGVIGKYLQTFSLTVAFAIIVSTVVALTVTPMLCGHYLRAVPKDAKPSVMDRALQRVVGVYERSLRTALNHVPLVLLSFVVTIGLTIALFGERPRGYVPTDDTGFVLGWTRAGPETSFAELRRLHDRAAAIVAEDPAVAHIGSFINPGSTGGQLMVALKPLEERKLSAQRVVQRIREKTQAIDDFSVWLVAAQDVRISARGGRSEYQFSLWSGDLDLLRKTAPLVAERIKQVPGVVDVSTDQEGGGLQADVKIDRDMAARLRVNITSVVAALNNVFSQRQVAVIYGERNQYRVVLAAEPRLAQGPDDITDVYVPSATGAQVPLSSLATVNRSLAPLQVNHQGQYAAVTVSFGLKPDVTLGVASPMIRDAVRSMALPEAIKAEFAGDAAVASKSGDDQIWLVLGALVAIYILLGILYENLVHPLTILSTLPSAALGALIALKITNTDLTLIAFIGIILLIGIVKKNGIMLVDQALELQRDAKLDPREAVVRAACERFRPILMTTLAAMLGALPLLLGEGPGAELRRPLGITVVGGLFLSQVLTLYTTPAIFLAFARLSEWRANATPLARLRTRTAA